MTDTAKLEARITASGLKRKAIAERMGISAYGLAQKIAGKREFKAQEISNLCSILEITSLKEKEDIFF